MKKQVSLLYRDASFPVRKRVEDLFGNMIMEEKVAEIMKYISQHHHGVCFGAGYF